MPVDFLTAEQQRRYGRYAGEPSLAQLGRYFHLDDTDRTVLKSRRGDHNRLGFALQLGTVRFLGTFLDNPVEVPDAVIAYVARQMAITDLTCLARYGAGETRWDHANEIKAAYGYRDFSDPPGHSRLIRWLYARAWVGADRPSLLFDLATAWLVERKVLLPGVTVLAREVAQARDRAAARLWRVLAAAPDSGQRKRLEALLVVPEGERQSHLDRLRRAPTRVSGPSLVAALGRLDEIRALGVAGLDLSRVPAGRLKALARHAASSWAAVIARMPPDRRIATLLAFARAFEATALDDALDLLDLIITELLAQAKLAGEKERLRTLRDLDAAALQLRDVCTVLLDETCSSARVRSLAFARVSRPRLAEAVALVESLARPPEDDYQGELLDRYRRVRRFWPCLLRTVTFQATQAGRPLVNALSILASLEDQREPDLSRLPLDVVSRAWRRFVVNSDRTIDRRGYTLCVLYRLQDGRRRRDVFVDRSERWGDPRAKLLHGTEWEAARSQVCLSLGRQVTYYNFTSDQFTGFHGIVIPGTLRDSLFILEGLLEQETSLRPLEIMSDAAGASDVVFGLFWLLGYQFSPRLADIGEARFWRMDPAADHGALNGLARYRVNVELIARNWDDLLRVAGSLARGTIGASELIGTLLRSSRPSTLTRAIGELGRVAKTLYLLSYIDDETYRRRILTQLNRGESRHGVARAIFHGQRGEVRQRYREGQEDQLGALGLVVNVVVLWNTLYMDAALAHLRLKGVETKPEDVARLSPLGHENINFLGRYSFALSESVARGELRPLHDPKDTGSQAEPSAA